MREKGVVTPSPSPPLSISFKIPSLPSSMNKMYQINYNTRQIFMAPDVRVWKSKAKLFMPVWKVEEGESVAISLKFVLNFYFKNGNPRKIDGHNLSKVTVDSIVERYGIDDSAYKVPIVICKSLHSEDEQAVYVRLRKVKIRSYR